MVLLARIVGSALLVAGVACAAPTQAVLVPGVTPLPPGPVLLIGDSIMVGASEYGGLAGLVEEEGHALEAVVESGRTVPWATGRVTTRTTVPDLVVVGLGSNPGPTLRAFPDEARALIAALRARGAERILWVPPHHVEPDRYAERVAALRALEGDGVEVLDWPARLDAHREWFHEDGLHLTAEGYGALAAFIADAMAANS